MDEFAIDLDKVLDEFEETEGCSPGHGSAKNGGTQEPEDNDIDLSEADFAPAHCSVLLKPCVVNGNEFDNAAVSDSTFPVCGERRGSNGSGTFSNYTDVTSTSVHSSGAGASASASVHHDAIGLPLFTENVACYEAVTCQNSVLSVQDMSASNNHVIKSDLDNHISSNSILSPTTDSMCSALNVSSANLASPSSDDRHLTCEDVKQLDSCVGSDKNVVCEKSDAVEALNDSDETVDSRVNMHDDQEFTVEPSRQNTETINQLDGNPKAPVGAFSGVFDSSGADVITSQVSNEVQCEEMVVTCGDSCVAQLSPLMTEETGDVDDGMDEVDKTVTSLHRMYSPTMSVNKGFEAGAPCDDHDHLLDDNKKDLADGESLWIEKGFDETCGIDHVERITNDNVSKSRLEVKIDSRAEVRSADEELSSSEHRSESDVVVDAQKTVKASEATACTTESIVCEVDSYDDVTSRVRVPLQSAVAFPLDTDRSSASLPCSSSTVDTVIMTDITESLQPEESEEMRPDIADRMRDVPVADDQNQVDSLESLQKCVEMTDVVRPSLMSDAGDAENAELHQKPLKQSEDDSGASLAGVVIDSVVVDGEQSAPNETMVSKAFPEVQLSDDLSLRKVEESEAHSSIAPSLEPNVQETEVSVVDGKEDEQEKYDLSNNRMLDTGLHDLGEQVDVSVNADSLALARVVDIFPFNADTGNSLHAGIGDIEKDKSHAEMRLQLTDSTLTPDQEQKQSDEDAEKWFEEQFAACGDFDVDDFVSSAWNAFHLDSEPAVGNIHDEMLEQPSDAADAADDNAPVQLDTADAWQYVENAAVATSAVDDSCQPSSDEYLDNEMESESCYPPSSQPEVTQSEPPMPAQMSSEFVPPEPQFVEQQVLPPSPPPYVGPPLCANINLPITQLGKVAPVWRPDSDTLTCMQCEIPFTFTRRRHHCRACGKIFCNGCCNLKATLPIIDNKEARVCSKCYQDLIRAQIYARGHMPLASHDPSIPGEYYSAVSPQSPMGAEGGFPPAMMPTGVLRKQGTVRSTVEPKQVMFSDGIRPGGDLTELDGMEDARCPVQSSGRRTKKVDKSAANKTRALLQSKKAVSNPISSSGYPPVVISPLNSREFSLHENPSKEYILAEMQKADASSSAFVFAIDRNLLVLVRMITLNCCMRRTCWSFTTRGLCTVGQDEVVILLECLQDESVPPPDVFHHIIMLYEQASQGNTVSHLGHMVFPPGSFSSQEIGGYLFIHQTYQCLEQLTLPEPPYLFALLLQKWEMPWARAFPLRLMLRLGAEFRYYPCPLMSVRNRKPVYGEIGHTIMNLLADFHNFQYTLPQIGGFMIHMEEKQTHVRLPRSRYNALMKVLNNSDDHVVAFGASFSMAADSHLVCLQNDDGQYQTQAINIQNRPRRVTGACFVVFNGALKPASGLRAKSSIIEDGLMVQITAESLAELKQCLREMKGYVISCGSLSSPEPDELVSIEWTADERNISTGMKSAIDGRSLDGFDSLRVHTATDYIGKAYIIRWTELFFVSYGGSGSDTEQQGDDPAELSRLAEHLAQAFCLAVTPHLEPLAFEMLTKIGLRVTIGSDQVGYEVGSGGARLPDYCMNDLDEKLIPVINSAVSPPTSGQPIVLELIFYILHQLTSVPA